ncbi:MAG: murein biosynthesis integral membrane protein MurJ [Spirochaetota bacterium]
MHEKKKAIVRSSAKMSVMTMISRIFGLVRDQLQAHFLGTTMLSDSFSVGFLIPNLLRRLFAEGSMTVSFVPVFTDVEHARSKAETQRFLSSFFTLLALILVVVTVLGYFAAPLIVKLLYASPNVLPEKYDLTVTLTRIMFPYIMFISLAAVVQGVLNVHGNFTVPAFTPVVLNIAIIGTVLLVHFCMPGLFPNLTYAFAFGTMAGGFCQLAFQLPFLWRTGYSLYPSFAFNDPKIVRVAKLFAPGIIGVGIYQVNVLVSYGFASSLGDGRISALMFSSRINELTLGIFAVSVATVMLPTLSRELLAKNIDAFVSSMSYSVRIIALVTIPATIGVFVLAEPIVSLLFRFGKFNADSVHLTADGLVFISIALFFIAAYRIIAQAFYSLKDTRTPVAVSALVFAMNALLCFVFTRIVPMDIRGIGLANSLSNIVMFVLLVVLLMRRLRTNVLRDGLGSFLTTIAAAVVMGAAAFALKYFFLPPTLDKLSLGARLFGIIAVSIAVYVTCNVIFGNKDMREFASALAGKLKRMRKG